MALPAERGGFFRFLADDGFRVRVAMRFLPDRGSRAFPRRRAGGACPDRTRGRRRHPALRPRHRGEVPLSHELPRPGYRALVALDLETGRSASSPPTYGTTTLRLITSTTAWERPPGFFSRTALRWRGPAGADVPGGDPGLGWAHLGELSLPPWSDKGGKREKPLPMVLFVHGGPWWRDRWGSDPRHQWLANRGYAVLSVNFRGSGLTIPVGAEEFPEAAAVLAEMS